MNTTQSKQNGMTLIELLVVVVIVAVLASIALPSWTAQVQKSRRADARVMLMMVQVEQQKYRSNYSTYASSMTALGLSSYESGDYYNGAIASADATSYTATATPTGSQSGDSCGTFAVNQMGADTSGSYADADCW